jgi:thioesterase domain-containing protein
MAASYIKEIQTLQPCGPYFLGGYSFGGLVAYEMARQLHAQGQKVGILVLFDSDTPEWLKPAPFHVQVSRHLSKLLRLELKDKLRYVKRKLIRRFYSIKPPLPPLEEAHHNAYRHYVTQVYPGRAILFRASEPPEEWLDWLQSMKIDPQLGWGKLVAGGLEIQEVPGKHTSMLTEPYVQFLAEKLKACLDSAQADI